MKMENQMNCLLGLRMDINALEMQRKEYGNDIDLVMKQPHTLGTCQCIGEGVNYHVCQPCDDHESDCIMYAVMENEISRAEDILEDMLMDIWSEQDHMEAPDDIVLADAIEMEDLDRFYDEAQEQYDIMVAESQSNFGDLC